MAGWVWGGGVVFVSLLLWNVVCIGGNYSQYYNKVFCIIVPFYMYSGVNIVPHSNHTHYKVHIVLPLNKHSGMKRRTIFILSCLFSLQQTKLPGNSKYVLHGQRIVL